MYVFLPTSMKRITFDIDEMPCGFSVGFRGNTREYKHVLFQKPLLLAVLLTGLLGASKSSNTLLACITNYFVRHPVGLCGLPEQQQRIKCIKRSHVSSVAVNTPPADLVIGDETQEEEKPLLLRLHERSNSNRVAQYYSRLVSLHEAD